MSDPLDVLRAHVRNVADAAPSRTNVDELVAQITLEHHRGIAAGAAAHPPRPPRRWGSVVVGVALCVGVGAGAVVTAAVIDRARVTNPQTGVLCHVSVDDPTSGVLLPSDDDPVGACSQLWRSGELPVIGETSEPTDPTLAACTGTLGLVEVFPGDSDQVCTAVGMAVAEMPSLADVPLHQLSLRVVSEINEQCLPPDEAQRVARSLLDEFGFQSWSVVPQRVEGLRNGCSKGFVASEDEHALYVNFTPPSG